MICYAGFLHIIRNKEGQVKRSRTLSGVLWIPLLTLFLTDVAFGAAAGTAHLKFRKTAIRTGIVSRKAHQPYIIKRGDTITEILRWVAKEDLSLIEIKQLNPHIPNLNKIYPGQKLFFDRQEEQKDSLVNSSTARTYQVRRGDSITRIIIHEMQASSAEVTGFLQSIRKINPQISNLNKIYPGQILNLPGAKHTETAAEIPVQPALVQPEESKKAVLPLTTAPSERDLSLFSQIIRQLDGSVIRRGNYYIPLASSGQLTIDCSTIPVVELDDGTTVLLDISGRLPDTLASVIGARWPNYHLVKASEARNVITLLQETIRPSTYEIQKVSKPLFLSADPQIQLLPDWLISKKTTSGDSPFQLAIFFDTHKSQVLPKRILDYAQTKGIRIIEILEDNIQEQVTELAVVPPLEKIASESNKDLIHNALIFLGLNPIADKDIKIFDTEKDGFNLSIKADYAVTREGKTLLIVKNVLSQQFKDILKDQGMDTFCPAPGATKRNLMESLMTALSIPCHYALYAFPPKEATSRFHVYFPALKVDGAQGTTYFIDFAMERNLYELLAEQGKLKIVCY